MGFDSRFLMSLLLGGITTETVLTITSLNHSKPIRRNSQPWKHLFRRNPRQTLIQTCAIGSLFAFAIGTWRIAPALASVLFFASYAIGRIIIFHRYRTQCELQLPPLLRNIAASLRAGSSLTGSFSQAVDASANPLRDLLTRMVVAQRLNIALSESLVQLADGLGSTDYRLVAAAVAINNRQGGALADTFDRLGIVIQEHQQLNQKRRAVTAQGRFQAIVLTLVPPLTLLVFFRLDPSLLSAALRYPIAIKCLIGSAMLELLGLLWVYWIARKRY